MQAGCAWWNQGTGLFSEPRRYVGVVIEEDGKTEGEFVEEIIRLNEELKNLNAEALNLEELIDYNINQIAEVEWKNILVSLASWMI